MPDFIDLGNVNYFATPDVKARIAEHQALVGVWPNRTPEQQAHQDQVKGSSTWYGSVKIAKFICPACGIRWQT